jgi:hypothetical protein
MKRITRFGDLLGDVGFHITQGRLWKVRYVKKVSYVSLDEDIRRRLDYIDNNFKGVRKTEELSKLFLEVKIERRSKRKTFRVHRPT